MTWGDAPFQADSPASGGGPHEELSQELWFNIPAQRALVNITPEVEGCL